MLSIQTFGTLQVRHAGEIFGLPASRKTRALLAYLVLSSNAHRRERLCELFWRIPDDPRGALRWSLSKLRPVLNAGGRVRLLTDYERVQVDAQAIAIDLHELRACAVDENASTDELVRAWEQTGRTLIEDCDLPNLANFTAWLECQRNAARELRIRLAQRLALSPDLPVEEAEKWTERWLSDAPYDPRAAQQAVTSRRKLGREQDALALASALENSFREAGLRPPSFTESAAAADLACIANSYEKFTPALTAIPAEINQQAAAQQTIRLILAGDQSTLAWGCAGTAGNPPLVKVGNWLTHLELDWEAPVFSPLFRELARTFSFVRYDERGGGLSDWEVPEISFATFVSDLEMVVDAAGLQRFPLLGIGHGAAVSIEYAARHPERVSHLVLFGGYAAGWRHTATAEEVQLREAAMVVTQAAWARDSLVYQNFVSGSFMSEATFDELRWLDRFLRSVTSPRNAQRFLDACSHIDVRERLKEVKAPTLVMHSRGDPHVPLAEGRGLAVRIANAQFLVLDSNNHLLLGREPASSEFIQAVRRFLTRA